MGNVLKMDIIETGKYWIMGDGEKYMLIDFADLPIQVYVYGREGRGELDLGSASTPEEKDAVIEEYFDIEPREIGPDKGVNIRIGKIEIDLDR